MKTKLEKTIRAFMHGYSPELQFRVMAHELWREPEGWTSNDRFRIASGTVDEIMPAILGRWEAFKVNYAPRATVKSLNNTSFMSDNGIHIESDCLPFIDIETIHP